MIIPPLTYMPRVSSTNTCLTLDVCTSNRLRVLCLRLGSMGSLGGGGGYGGGYGGGGGRGGGGMMGGGSGTLYGGRDRDR